MSKLLQALLSGMFFTFILDFFLFLGIKLNYIDYYEIDLYYNILFADNQSAILFFLFSLIIGYITLYTNIKLALYSVGFLFVLSFSTLIAPIGKSVGTFLLAKEDVTLQTSRFSYHGDILYNGREKVTFFDKELNKIIILNKNKIKGKI
ncbi:hypothetical protein [Sulfurimonas marina]|uniref:Uncharacterized protein n=1 Tax=Sulfurimonas marina TaxID=2590551 RepID=A0A7M1ATY6_9BACT|nr:hypothetical protein [Sulfurimonas marina]QOP40879.1 hypothetical protein FJR03_03645 [Sulfurimonas marina]